MSVKNVVHFFKKLEQDEEFRNKLVKDESLKNKSFDSLMAVAAAEGFSFSEEEFKQAQAEMKDMELSEEELEKVVGGGTGFGTCLYFGLVIDPNKDNPNTEFLVNGLCLFLIGTNEWDS